MTRGKHTNSARVRREAAEQEAEIGVYQRKVAELAAQIAKIKREQATAEQHHRNQVRILQAQVDEATSPRVTVLENENTRLRSQRDHAQGQHRDIQRKWERVTTKILEHAESEHGMTRTEALEWFTAIAIDMPNVTISNDNKIGDAKSTRIIQRARGERHAE